MLEIILRRAEARDTEHLAKNVVAMAWDARSVTLDTEVVLAAVRKLLESPALGFYFVAELDKQIIGSAMITYEWSDWRNGVYWWIQSVYVNPELRRKGVYRKMYDFVRAEARKASDVRGLNLYVYKENLAARRSYEALGMKEASSIIYSAPEI